MLRIAILASHGGSNAQAIIDGCASGNVDAQVALVVSNNSSAGVLERAKAAGIETLHMSSVTHGEELDSALCAALEERKIDLVALAGYMKRLGPQTLESFEGRILNVHPALLPKFGGQGMFGMKVHEAVLESGETVSGATVHLVDEGYDTGRPLAAAEVPVLEGDTAKDLAERVLAVEHKIYPATIDRIARGEIHL